MFPKYLIDIKHSSQVSLSLFTGQSFSVSFLELSAHFSWEAKVFPNKAFTQSFKRE